LLKAVLITGAIIAVLSYLFHPDVGIFKLFVNSHPVDNTLVQFAAISSVLVVIFC